MGFFPARRRRACPPLADLPAFGGVSLRMTVIFFCHPEASASCLPCLPAGRR